MANDPESGHRTATCAGELNWLSSSLILMMSHFLLSQKSTQERFLVHCFSLDEKALIPKEEIIYLLTEAS